MTKRRHQPQGPFGPPLPTDVEANGPEPMAVARDKQQTHGESFLPTSAPMDAYDDEVAQRYRQVPDRELGARGPSPSESKRAMMPSSRTEKVHEAEHTTGHSEPDEDGWAHPRNED